MPDLTMCMNNDCDLSRGCRRHQDSGTKPVSLRQSWSVFPTFKDKKGCLHLIPVRTSNADE